MIPTVTDDTTVAECRPTLPAPIDLAVVHHAWLSPKGEWHPVPFEGHDYYAGSVLKERQSALYRKGWLKLSQNWWYDEWSNDVIAMPVTQAQFNEIEKWFRSGATRQEFKPGMFQAQ